MERDLNPLKVVARDNDELKAIFDIILFVNSDEISCINILLIKYLPVNFANF